MLMERNVGFLPAILAGFAVCAAIGLLNGFITLRFAIPSFITTLGMLFIARSLTVVISGGFPPVLPDDIPAWLFTQFIGPGGLIRMSFLWFVAHRAACLGAAVADQCRQLDQIDRRLPGGGGGDGHSGERREDWAASCCPRCWRDSPG